MAGGGKYLLGLHGRRRRGGRGDRGRGGRVQDAGQHVLVVAFALLDGLVAERMVLLACKDARILQRGMV